jgi:DNA-binding CsgD family transcriptional regulator
LFWRRPAAPGFAALAIAAVPRRRTIATMLVGRESEQQQLAALLVAARVHQSRVLVLSGEPGIGKTALLDDTAAAAGEMRMLRISGSEQESGLGFAGLQQLLSPALPLLGRIPAPQRDALAVALMLRDGPAPERFAVCVGALSLISRLAEERPLLVLVDDAHLLDLPSAEALLFIARRLVADPIALLMSLRPEPDALLYNCGLPALELSGLDRDAAGALLATAAGGSPGPEMAARLHQVTAGNPLALIELARDGDRLGRAVPELPMPVTETIARAFARRVSTLPAAAQRVLLLTAVADGDLSVTAQAAAALDCDSDSEGIESLADAEGVGLLRLRSGRAEFRHPLVRSAVYAVAAPEERRAAHRAVAAALPESSADRRSWHLSEACVGPDDAVADMLAKSAEHARARGAYGTAAIGLARSAELTTVHESRGLRLFRAGDSAWLAGRVSTADEFLSAAKKLLTDPARLAEIDEMRGSLALRTGSLREAHAMLSRSAERAAASHPDAAVRLLADAVIACFYLCDAAAATSAADRIEALLDDCGSDVARTRGQMAVGMARVLAGDQGMHWIRAAVESMTKDPQQFEDPRRPDLSVMGPLFLRESRAGRELIGRVVAEQRAKTALGALPNLLFHMARDDATTDRWSSALGEFDEGITLATETGQTTDLAASLAGLGWLQARMGRAEECRRHCDQALALAHSHQIVLAELWARFALGDLSLATGDAAAAVQEFIDLQKAMSRNGFHDVDLAPGPELAEAQVRRGELAAAAVTAGAYQRRAQQKGQPWALARARRAMALVSTDPGERNALFEQAIRLHEGSLDLYEEARTRLAFGASLRRDKSRVAARPLLREALKQFERLGARPWADRTASELDATGERARRSGEDQLSALTSQEIRIAQLLGAGRTTKETAAALFLSPKTVEYHLRHIYQKLGIRSRGELTAIIKADAR